MRKRRQYERVPFLVEAELTVALTERLLRVSTVALSRGGVEIFSTVLLPVSSQVRLSFKLPVGDGIHRTPQLAAQIMHHRIGLEGNLIGLQFDSPLTRAADSLLWEILQSALRRPRVED